VLGLTVAVRTRAEGWRLRLDAAGVTVRGHETVPWSDLAEVRLAKSRRRSLALFVSFIPGPGVTADRAHVVAAVSAPVKDCIADQAVRQSDRGEYAAHGRLGRSDSCCCAEVERHSCGPGLNTGRVRMLRCRCLRGADLAPPRCREDGCPSSRVKVVRPRLRLRAPHLEPLGRAAIAAPTEEGPGGRQLLVARWAWAWARR
jgi:hypothetical protein